MRNEDLKRLPLGGSVAEAPAVPDEARRRRLAKQAMRTSEQCDD